MLVSQMIEVCNNSW